MSKHYENFPVASLLLPKVIRSAVMHIYHFARAADDIADEGNHSPEERTRCLQHYRDGLDAMARAQPLDAEFHALASTIHTHKLSLQPFRDLLHAFQQDVVQNRYADENALNNYCQYSANPIGELLLSLYRVPSPALQALADNLCSGLQKANFWQDIAVDWSKGRVYIPQTLLAQFQVSENHIAQQTNDKAWQNLLQHCITQTRQQLIQAQPLANAIGQAVAQQQGGLQGCLWGLRLRLEVRLIQLGGLAILQKIEHNQFDIWHRRPTLNRSDWLRLIRHALFSPNTTHPLSS